MQPSNSALLKFIFCESGFLSFETPPLCLHYLNEGRPLEALDCVDYLVPAVCTSPGLKEGNHNSRLYIIYPYGFFF
jgi:hypothetical protein